MNILGQASTRLPEGLVIVDDIKTEDIESGVASFEFNIRCDKENFDDVRNCLAVGNYVLRSRDDENEFYTIIETETDTREQEIYVYAEDAGLDLLNEIVGAYVADKAYDIAYYINKFTFDSGFVIGINEASDLTRRLSWDDEQTAAERVRSIATQFDCEISYSFDIDGLYVTKKYINIYRSRGNDNGVQLRLNKEIDRIVTKESIANIATALSVTGGTPDDSDTPITLSGYTYDDGDFYVQGRLLKCRSALQKWSRYIWADEPDKVSTEGQIVRTYSYDTTSQAELLKHALAELKRVSEIERNYEVDVTNLPDDAKIGDRVNVIDSTGGLFVSARILKLESSDTRQENKVTLGEYLIKGNGISQRLSDMADEFAKTAATSERARTLANSANATALAAQATAETANSAANGKGRAYYQPTAPTEGTGGDVWFDTAHGNAIYQYGSSGWSLMPLGTDSIADRAVTDAKVSNLDAGSITTGTLNAIDITGCTFKSSETATDRTEIEIPIFDESGTRLGKVVLNKSGLTAEAEAQSGRSSRLVVTPQIGGSGSAEAKAVLTSMAPVTGTSNTQTYNTSIGAGMITIEGNQFSDGEEGSISHTNTTLMDTGIDTGGWMTGHKGICGPYIQATGTASSLAMARNTITQVPLGAVDASMYASDAGMTVTGGAINVAEAGLYRISGSVYIVRGSASAGKGGVYINAGSSFESSKEVIAQLKYTDNNLGIQYACGPKIVSLSAGQNIYLAARCMGDTGECLANNPATFLLVERLT